MNIFRFIIASIGFTGATVSQIRIAYDRLVRFMLIVMLPALLISYLLNIGVSRWDWSSWLGYVPYVFGLLLTMVFLVIAFSPEVLAITGISNIAQARYLPPTDPQHTIWSQYKKNVWLIVAWINIPFMYLGGVPAGVNPMAVFAIISTITIFSAISERSIWRKVVTCSAVILLSINLLSLVSQPMYYWLTGKEMSFQIRRTEKAILNLDKAQADTRDKKNAEIIAKLQDKVEAGEELTPKELAFLKAARAERDSQTLPAKAAVKLTEVSNTIVSLIPETKQVEAKAAPDVVTPAPAQTIVYNTTYVQAIPPAEKPVEVAALPTMRLGLWHLSCIVDDEAVGEDMVVQKADTTIHIVGKKTGTTFDGSVVNNHYEGTLSDPFNGKGVVSVQPLSDREATGSWNLNGNANTIAFRMKFIG
ncbi:MAG: hypothetical protein Q7T51_01530 [Candidatus Moranbacteria bacterium]|nr:hypothetical protein [Candidatus Moranbacteria bacterium]